MLADRAEQGFKHRSLAHQAPYSMLGERRKVEHSFFWSIWEHTWDAPGIRPGGIPRMPEWRTSDAERKDAKKIEEGK